METQRLFPFAVLSSFETFPTAVKNTSCKVPDFNKIWISSPRIFVEVRLYEISRKSVQSEQRWYMGTDGRTRKLTGAFHELWERA